MDGIYGKRIQMFVLNLSFNIFRPAETGDRKQ